MRAAIETLCARRTVAVQFETLHESAAVPCAPWLMSQIERAIARQNLQPLRLPSGAGHDAMAMAAIVDVGMIFVRCAAGISHNPDERISAEDAATGVATLLQFVRDFEPETARAPSRA